MGYWPVLSSSNCCSARSLILRDGRAPGAWPVIDAIISKSEKRDFVLGTFGRVIILHYKYRSAGQRYEGVYREPFYFDNYATAYLNRFPGGTTLPVRVNPKNFSRSFPDNPKVEFIKVT